YSEVQPRAPRGQSRRSPQRFGNTASFYTSISSAAEYASSTTAADTHGRGGESSPAAFPHASRSGSELLSGTRVRAVPVVSVFGGASWPQSNPFRVPKPQHSGARLCPAVHRGAPVFMPAQREASGPTKPP